MGLMDCALSDAPVTPRRARLLLVAQAAAARLGLTMEGRAVGKGVVLGEAAAALGPRGAMRFAAAWLARSGTWNPANTALLHAALGADGAAEAAARAAVARAAREVEILARLPVQPPPAGYLVALLARLLAPGSAEDAAGPCAAAALPLPVQADLLYAVAQQPRLREAPGAGAALDALVPVLLRGLLAQEAPAPKVTVRALTAVAWLRERHGYTPDAE
jgi:hypothetical protein